MKIRFFLTAAAVLFFVSTGLVAANKNQSVEYVRSLNRNASTDVDASYYNPAGLTKMSDGLHLEVSNQSIFQTKTIEDNNPAIAAYGEDEYKGEINAWLFPDVHVAYNMNNLAFFGNMIVVGGGGGGTYDDGLPQFELMTLSVAQGVATQIATGAGLSSDQYAITDYSRDLSFEGEEYNLGWTLGAAYEINQMISVAGGYRLTYAYRHYQGHSKNLSFAMTSGNAATDTVLAQYVAGALAQTDTDVEVDTTGTAFGHTFITGVNIAPMDALNIGIRAEYQLKTEREYDADTISGPDAVVAALNESYGDGVKEEITEPPLLAFGISYNITKEFRVEADFTYEFYEVTYDDCQNAFFTGLALEYTVMPQLLVSCGYAYDSSYGTTESRTETDLALPVHHFAAGAEYALMNNLSLGLGYLHSFYQEGEREYDSNGTTYTQTMNKTNFDIGVGVKYDM